MVEVRAADLPEGSIIAKGARIYFRIDDRDDNYPWRSATTGWDAINDHESGWVDEELRNGATVLRHGYGDEGQP